MIASDVVFGEDVAIRQPQLVNLYGCTIGDRSRIGAFVEIQRGAVIGRACKISSHSFICDGVTIEDGVFVGHGVMFTNDLFPRALAADGQLQTDADWELVSTHVAAGASIGSNVTIVAGVTIGRGASSCAREYQVIRLGVVGYGYWGPNVVRNFAEVPGCQLFGVSDMRAERLAMVRSRYPAVKTYADPNELIADRRIDAVVIVTPVSTHYDLAMQALRAGKHVLVEKPLAASSEQAIRLVDEAERRKLILSVDHTFVYTGAVRKIRELVTNESLGDIYYYDSVRVNLGLFQHDVNVIWDLAVHDLAIMDHVLPAQPCAVSATGMSHLDGEHENIAYLTLFFQTNLIAHLHVNWLAPVKVRRTLIGGSRKMIVYDDLEPSEKIKVYDKGVTLNGASGNG